MQAASTYSGRCIRRKPKLPPCPVLLNGLQVECAGLAVRALSMEANMARYTVHVSDRGALTGVRSALNAVRAYCKVRELRDQGFQCVTLTSLDTGEETDVESLVRDSPHA